MNQEVKERLEKAGYDFKDNPDEKTFNGKSYEWTKEVAEMINELNVSLSDKCELYKHHTGKNEMSFVLNLKSACQKKSDL